MHNLTRLNNSWESGLVGKVLQLELESSRFKPH